MPIIPSQAARSGGRNSATSVQARQLVDEMHEELAGVEDQIRRLPYFAALESGQLPLNGLASLAGEQYNVIKSDLRSGALLLSRFGTTSAGMFFKRILEGEILALSLLRDFAKALGLAEEDLEAYEPRAGAQAYPAYVAWLAAYASEAETSAAFLMNFPIFGESMGRISAALQSRYGLVAQNTAFFDFFATPIQNFESDALAVITAGLKHGTKPRVIKRAARLLQAYEKLFWDTVAGETERTLLRRDA